MKWHTFFICVLLGHTTTFPGYFLDSVKSAVTLVQQTPTPVMALIGTASLCATHYSIKQAAHAWKCINRENLPDTKIMPLTGSEPEPAVKEYILSLFRTGKALASDEDQKIVVVSGMTGDYRDQFWADEQTIYMPSQAYEKLKHALDKKADVIEDAGDVLATLFHERGHIVYEHSKKREKSCSAAKWVAWSAWWGYALIPLAWSSNEESGVPKLGGIVLSIGGPFAAYSAYIAYSSLCGVGQEKEADMFVVEHVSDKRVLLKIAEYYTELSKKRSFSGLTHPSNTWRAEFFKKSADALSPTS